MCKALLAIRFFSILGAMFLANNVFAAICLEYDENGQCAKFEINGTRELPGDSSGGGWRPTGGGTAGGAPNAMSNSGTGNVKDLCNYGRTSAAVTASTSTVEERVLAARDVQTFLLVPGYRGTFLVTYADGGTERFTATALSTPVPIPGTLAIGNQPVTGC